jgi:hypothetical protein
MRQPLNIMPAMATALTQWQQRNHNGCSGDGYDVLIVMLPIIDSRVLFSESKTQKLEATIKYYSYYKESIISHIYIQLEICIL